jgi:hypothetical protein
MILCQDIVAQCLSLLDAENSDRYRWDEDFLPAITSTNTHLVSIFNASFAANKLSPESLKEITYAKIWQTSYNSRFAFDSTQVGHSLWTILAIYPKITTIPTTPTLAAPSVESIYRSDISFKDSNYSCKRITAEEWTLRNVNPFIAGSSLITCPDLIQYAYTDFTDYTGGYPLTHNKFEIEIAPSVANELICMRYLKSPTIPTVIGDSLDFPVSLTNLAVQLTMRFIGIKQGEIPTYQATQFEINELTKQLS